MRYQIFILHQLSFFLKFCSIQNIKKNKEKMKKKNYKSVHSHYNHSNEQSSQIQSALSKNNEYSANTKPSIHQTSLHHRARKKNKGKSPALFKQKDPEKKSQLSKKQQISSKNSRKFMKISMNTKNNKGKVAEPQKIQIPSYREYCIVEGNFIPLATSNEKRFLNSVMIQTACTSSEIKSELMNRNQKDSISAEKLRVEFKNYSVLVKAAQEDRGVQYSNRSLDSLGKERDKNISFTEQEEQSLQDTCFKIQFCHLPNKQIFQDLTIEQKRHFRTIFQQLCQRLRSPRVISPNIRFSSDTKQIQLLKFLKKQPSTSQVQKYALLQKNVFLRQAQQKNQSGNTTEKQIYFTAQGIDQICTSILQYIQEYYSKQFINLMNKMYGWSFGDKFRFISRIQKEHPEKSLPIVLSEIKKRQIEFKILGQKLFFNFFEEFFNDKDEQLVQYFFHMSKCIFDSINEILVHYQPYFCTKGDPFPWSTKIFPAITFFSIDLESIEALFQQVRQKVFSFTDQYLCGIMVDSYEACFDFQTLCTSEMFRSPDPVLESRWNKEQKLLISDIKNEDMSIEMEIADTCILFELSELIIEDLLNQTTKEIKTLK